MTLRDALTLPPDQRQDRCAACLTAEHVTRVPPAVKVCRPCRAEALRRIENPRRPGTQQAPRCSGCGTFSITSAEHLLYHDRPRVTACTPCLVRKLAEINREQAAAADPDRAGKLHTAHTELEAVIDQYNRPRKAGNTT